MGIVIYSDGREVSNHELLEYLLADACFKDDFQQVASLLNANIGVIDCNAVVALGKSCVGTPLALTGRKDIAEVLILAGAEINKIFPSKLGVPITALDSAKNSLKADYVSNQPVVKGLLEELILYFELHGGKMASELIAESKLKVHH